MVLFITSSPFTTVTIVSFSQLSLELCSIYPKSLLNSSLILCQYSFNQLLHCRSTLCQELTRARDYGLYAGWSTGIINSDKYKQFLFPQQLHEWKTFYLPFLGLVNLSNVSNTFFHVPFNKSRKHGVTINRHAIFGF